MKTIPSVSSALITEIKPPVLDTTERPHFQHAAISRHSNTFPSYD